MANTNGDIGMVEVDVGNVDPLTVAPVIVSQTSSASILDVASATSPRSIGKRKTVPRSDVWGHYTKLDGGTKCKCNYCGFVYMCDTISCGTSTLRSHLRDRCKKSPLSTRNKLDNKQAQISIHASGNNEGIDQQVIISNWKFDQQAIRKALAYMVIKDELPFKFVEGLGFKYFCSVAQPKFSIPVRTTIARDSYEIYVHEMMKLKSFMKTHCRRICLTTDTWTSVQRINYMCLTAHFIDNDWKLNKKILNFCPISSHRGDAIGKAIEKCLNTWAIEKVMCVTVDNASSNDVAVAYLKRRINNWDDIVLKGEFLHMRCVAHILNLVVNDGLKLANDVIVRIRNDVRYVRQSPSRLQKFKTCVEEEKIQSKSLLCLDVPTRWNSTLLMLDTALKFQKVFERYEEQNPFFRSELIDGDGLGRPQDEDWEKARNLTKVLQTFYLATLRVSGTLYVTSNSYLHEISNVDCILKEWCKNQDQTFDGMAVKMKQKCDKYWGNPEKMNLMLFIAVILDPRYKLEYVDFSITQMYNNEMAMSLQKKLKATIIALYDEYKNIEACSGSQRTLYVSQDQSSSSCANTIRGESGDQPLCEATNFMLLRYKQHRAEKESGDVKSELAKYLEEETTEMLDAFDILSWWKVNSVRFPTLSLMARDVLAIPVSTVASESAFSTRGRVLDPFRSSLSPKIVEALICTQDWIRAAKDRICVEEKLEEIEQLDEELASITSAPTVIDTA